TIALPEVPTCLVIDGPGFGLPSKVGSTQASSTEVWPVEEMKWAVMTLLKIAFARFAASDDVIQATVAAPAPVPGTIRRPRIHHDPKPPLGFHPARPTTSPGWKVKASVPARTGRFRKVMPRTSTAFSNELVSHSRIMP